MSRLSLLLLTEDSSADAPKVLQALVCKMLLLANPCFDPRHLHCDPATDKARDAMRPNGWPAQTARGHHTQVELTRTIIQKLLRARTEPSFVFFHIDGDRCWADSQEGQESTLLGQFHALLLPRIQAGLASQEQSPLLAHLIILMPYYSIEAWLFQNTQELQRIYQEHHPHGHSDGERIAAWNADPSLLDEVHKPKEALAIGAKHNARLATRSFPAQRALDAGKSFATAVRRIRECAPLMRALEAAQHA